jgi:peptide deformylase
MILKVLRYGHPALRQKGARIETVTLEIKKLIADMFETMYAHKGVGLAAQQVGSALQLTVIDVRGVTDRPSTLELDGKAADVLDFMPLVLINPEVKPVGEPVAGPEGCLSFPEIFADITVVCSPVLSSTKQITSTEFFSLIAWKRKPRKSFGRIWKCCRRKPKPNCRPRKKRNDAPLRASFTPILIVPTPGMAAPNVPDA